jgi:drug/metabolite transporter (DMT)-like permease
MSSPTQRTGASLAIFLIVATLIGWSSVPLFLKHFSHSIDAWTSNGWRYGFSALLWAPVLMYGAMRSSLPGGLWRAAIVPSIFNCAGQVCFTWAHYKIDPGLLTFGLRMQIVFVALGAYLLFPAERRVIRTPSFLLGAVTVFGGTIGTIWRSAPASSSPATPSRSATTCTARDPPSPSPRSASTPPPRWSCSCSSWAIGTARRPPSCRACS